ncbi:MAG TPA: phage holin family protein [Solirubrobacterales bacterium]|jgi:uncharacterized membrane protein YqjE
MTDGEPTQPPSSSEQGEAPPPPADAAGNGAKPPEEMSVGELVFEVSDRASVLIREEIELAKTEVTEKVNRLLRGSVAGLAAGIFVLFALFLLMFGVAWLLNDLVFNNFWAGFFVEAGVFILIGAAAGIFAWRSFKRGAPPTPDMAIEEAKEIKAAFGDGEEPT